MTYGIGSRTYDQFYRTGELLRAQFFSLDVFCYNSNPNWLCKFQLLQSKFKPINSSQFLSVINKSLANSMGTNHPTVFQTGEPLTNYDVVQKVPEHNLSYLKHKITNKQFLIKQFAINDKTEFTQLCQKLKNRKKLQSQYLTKLQRFSEQQEDHLCSSFYKVFAMWEYPSHTLADQINERTLQKRHFQQNQLFSIIASVIQGMSCLQSSGIKHQSLTTSTILFDQTGIVKITDPLTQIHPSNFQRINSNRKLRNVYIASEQCQALKNQRPIPNRNPFKSDVFVLGVIMLECGLLQRMEELYVDGFEDVDFQELAQKMEQFGKVYSRDLRLTVETMLAREPKQRMDWIGLKQYVPEKGESDKQRQIHSNKQVYNNFSNPNNKLINQNKNLSGLPISNQPSNIILGGRSGQQPSQLPPHLNNNNKYQHIPSSSQNRYTPLSIYNPPVYIRPTTSYIQPASSSQFNNTFGQPVHSFVYQPQITTKYYPAQSSLSSSFNPGSKISNYLYDDHKLGYGHMERPTEEYLNAGNTIRPRSKLTTGNNQFIEREQSSSFPLNSQVQFKKDYLYTETNSNLGYGMNQAHENNLSSNDKTNHQFMNIAPPITINKPQTQYQASSSGYSSIPTYFPSSSSSTPFTIPHYQQSSMVRPPLQAAQQPSLANRSPLLNDNKAQTLTQGPASPLMSTYVKDAKSITYENKGLYSSYMQQNNQSYAANSYQQESRDNYYEDKGNGQESYYQPISKAGNDSNAILNKNLQISNEQTQKPTNNYTSSQRNSSTYVLTSNPILYQPLNSNSATKQQTLPIGQPSSSYIQQQSTPSPSTYQYKQITNATNPHYVPQVYQQKAHHQSAYHPSEQQLQYVIEHFKQGSRYEGTKYQDMRHGQGKFFYQDGGMYEGNWKNNKMDGFGKLYYQSGKIAYEGNWTDDQFQGYGKLHNQQPDQINQMFDCENFDMIDQFWVFYEGTFIADQKDGEGKMVFNNGEQFIGNFYRDMVDGPGQFHRMNGEIVRGIWSQNQLVQLEE